VECARKVAEVIIVKTQELRKREFGRKRKRRKTSLGVK
jgi:hypothetical protein